MRKKTVAAKAAAKSASKATKVCSKHRIFLASRVAEAQGKELHWLAEIFFIISKYSNKNFGFNLFPLSEVALFFHDFVQFLFWFT
jgi:hypothetical protein